MPPSISIVKELFFIFGGISILELTLSSYSRSNFAIPYFVWSWANLKLIENSICKNILKDKSRRELPHADTISRAFAFILKQEREEERRRNYEHVFRINK